jgi:hypothetical protein
LGQSVSDVVDLVPAPLATALSQCHSAGHGGLGDVIVICDLATSSSLVDGLLADEFTHRAAIGLRIQKNEQLALGLADLPDASAEYLRNDDFTIVAAINDRPDGNEFSLQYANINTGLTISTVNFPFADNGSVSTFLARTGLKP